MYIIFYCNFYIICVVTLFLINFKFVVKVLKFYYWRPIARIFYRLRFLIIIWSARLLLGLINFTIMDMFYDIAITTFYGLFNIWYGEVFLSIFLLLLTFFLKFSFIYTFLLYLLATVASLFCLSYLTLYGVFVFNFIFLFYFWLSLILNFSYFLLLDNNLIINVGSWFLINVDSKFFFNFNLDLISYSFVLLTTTIAIFVYCYAFSYFRYEPHVERLLIFLNLFVLSMIIFVSAGNFILLFFGWELIGLTSFMLINFWTTRAGTFKAAFKAFTFNKFSDVSLLIFCIASYNVIYCVDIIVLQEFYYNFVNYTITFFLIEVNITEFLCFFLSSAALIKSAQIGGHIWLPDSMEAPVPASALIHSATLVSAGIYLILRFNFLYEATIFSYIFLPIIGSMTAFYGGLVASYQYDIKRILAYSTISHCGFLVVSAVMCSCEYTIFYLYVHGFFKAISFLCVGNIIRFNLNYQDIRFMGGFFKYLPFECCVLFISFLNLGGCPFTFGFFIKHILIITFNFNLIFVSYFVYLNLLFGAVTGLFYCSKIFFNVFFDFKKAKKIVYFNTIDAPAFSFFWDKVKFFSVTTFGSNFAISFLVLSAYCICCYVFVTLCCTDFLYSNLSFSSKFSEHFNYVNSDLNLLFNIGFFNVFILFFIAILSFSVVRYIPNSYIVYSYVALLFIFFFFFYCIFLIL